MKKIAEYISIILGPQLWLPILFVITILKSGLSYSQLIIILPTTGLLLVIAPLMYLYLAPKFGWADAWDLPNRSERYKFLAFVVALNVCALWIIYTFGNSFLMHLNIMTLSIIIVLQAITYFWKISLHTSLNTAGAIIVNFLFNWNLPILYLTIPLILWARLFLKRHNIYQLLAGIIISGLITFGILFFVG